MITFCKSKYALYNLVFILLRFQYHFLRVNILKVLREYGKH